MNKITVVEWVRPVSRLSKLALVTIMCPDGKTEMIMSHIFMDRGEWVDYLRDVHSYENPIICEYDYYYHITCRRFVDSRPKCWHCDIWTREN